MQQSQRLEATHDSTVSLQEIAALIPCETPQRGQQEEIMSRIGTIKARGWPRGWHVYVRAIFDLMLEPPAVDGRPGPKRFCAAGHRAIAEHLGRSVSATSEALGRLEDEGVITVVRPSDSTWPPRAGRQGSLIAPTWGVLSQRVRESDARADQLKLPMHGLSMGPRPSAAPRASVPGQTERSETPSAFTERSAAQPSALVESVPVTGALSGQSVPVTGTLCEKAHRLPVRLGGEGGGEGEILCFNKSPSPSETERSVSERSADWPELERRLVAYGLHLAVPALRAARQHGWTAFQVGRLLGWCESQVIGQVKAFGPGLLFRHLQCCPPGAKIEVKPSDEFRAARGKLRARASIDEDRSEDRDSSERLASRAAEKQELEGRFGQVLDGMPRAERDQLAVEAFGREFPLALTHYRRRGDQPLGESLRIALLRALRDQAGGNP